MIALVATVISCGGPQEEAHHDRSDSAGGYTLAVRGGAFNAGGGALSLAFLATLRDPGGIGPDAIWQIDITGPEGPIPASLAYSDGSRGSYVAWWLEGIPPSPGTYTVEARGPEVTLETEFTVHAGGGLAAPLLAAQGAALEWPAVDGAAAYTCSIASAAGPAASIGPTPQTTCDLSFLPDGLYTVSVRAFNTALEALLADAAPKPDLPEAFEISEARLAVNVGGGQTVTARAILGAIEYGTMERGLALWASVRGAEGAPPSAALSLTVIGPGLGAPWVVEYPMGAPQIITWAYDVAASPGSYSIAVAGPDGTVSLPVPLGDVVPPPPPTAITVEPTASSGAFISWAPTAAARSYQVTAWTTSTQAEMVAAVWSTTPDASFAAGTFASGVTYDVYVAATTVDMTDASSPDPEVVAVSENAYAPVSFTAR